MANRAAVQVGDWDEGNPRTVEAKTLKRYSRWACHRVPAADLDGRKLRKIMPHSNIGAASPALIQLMTLGVSTTSRDRSASSSTRCRRRSLHRPPRFVWVARQRHVANPVGGGCYSTSTRTVRSAIL